MTSDDWRVLKACAITIAAAMLEAGDRSAPEVVETASIKYYTERASDLWAVADAMAQGDDYNAIIREIAESNRVIEDA